MDSRPAAARARPAGERRKERMKPKIAALALLLGLAAPAWAADRADLEGTQILGNRELPKVLYIVPWKQPLPGEPVGRRAAYSTRRSRRWTARCSSDRSITIP